MHASGNGHYKVGQNMQVEALVDLPDLGPDDVAVQLYAGPVNAFGVFEGARPLTMEHVARDGPEPPPVRRQDRLRGPAAGTASRCASCPAAGTWRRRLSRG